MLIQWRIFRIVVVLRNIVTVSLGVSSNYLARAEAPAAGDQISAADQQVGTAGPG